MAYATATPSGISVSHDPAEAVVQNLGDEPQRVGRPSSTGAPTCRSTAELHDADKPDFVLISYLTVTRDPARGRPPRWPVCRPRHRRDDLSPRSPRNTSHVR